MRSSSSAATCASRIGSARTCPSPPAAVGSAITVAQLLDHTSGLGDFFADPRYEALKPQLTSLERYLPLIVGERLLFRPGARFSYSNSGYIALGLIVERVSGTGYYDTCRRTSSRARGSLEPPVSGVLSAALTKTVTTAKTPARTGPTRTGLRFRTGRPGDPPTIWHNGGFPGVGAELDMNPALGITVVVLANYDYPAVAPAIDLILNTLRVP